MCGNKNTTICVEEWEGVRENPDGGGQLSYTEKILRQKMFQDTPSANI